MGGPLTNKQKKERIFCLLVNIKNLKYMLPQCGLCNNVLKTHNRLEATQKKIKENV